MFFRSDQDELSRFLLLFLESSHEFNETFSNFKDESEKIVKNTEIKYLSAVSAGTNAIKFANSLRKLPISTFLGSGKTVKGQQFVQSFKSMNKYFVRSTENTWFKTENPFSKTSSVISQKWKSSTFGAHLSKVAEGVKNGLKYTAKFVPIIFDIGIGICKVLEGKKALNPGFIKHIFLTKREMQHETDALFDAFYQISGIEKKDYVPMSDSNTLFSLRVKSEYSGNVEFLLKTYDVKGKLRSVCKTNSLKLDKEWNIFDMGKDLGKCWDLEIFASNLTVTVITNHWLNILNLQVSVDGNYLPTFDIKKPIHLRRKQSEETPFEVMQGLKRIKTHTTDLKDAGTDSYVFANLKFAKQPDIETGWIELDNMGINNHERGQTDIFEGMVKKKDSEYQNMRTFFANIENFNDDDILYLTIWVDYMKMITSDAWNTDLIKVYYTGEDGKDNVMRCHAGEQWILDDKRIRFECKVMKPKNPEKSLQKIRAKTCNHYYAGMEDGTIKFRICKNMEKFPEKMMKGRLLDRETPIFTLNDVSMLVNKHLPYTAQFLQCFH